jgi:hypothetical protein
MRLSVSVTFSIIMTLSSGLSAPGSQAYAQACGCGETVVTVGDEEGNALDGVTVEFLLEGRTLRNCGLNGTPAKQSGSAPKFKFRFSSYEGGFRDLILLRVRAPGYTTYEEKNNFMGRCRERWDVVLRKGGPSYRT